MNVAVRNRAESAARGLTFPPVPAFFLRTFVLSWGTMSLYMLFQARFDAVFGEMGYTNPVYILAVYAPGLTGVFMVWRHYGLKGLASFFRRFTLWRMSLALWLVPVVGMS